MTDGPHARLRRLRALNSRVTQLFSVGDTSVGRHVRCLTSLHQFRQVANDSWVARAIEAPTLLPVVAMSVAGHVRTLTSLHRFRQSANTNWVTRAFEAPTLFPAGAMPVGGHMYTLAYLHQSRKIVNDNSTASPFAARNRVRVPYFDPIHLSLAIFDTNAGVSFLRVLWAHTLVLHLGLGIVRYEYQCNLRKFPYNIQFVTCCRLTAKDVQCRKVS